MTPTRRSRTSYASQMGHQRMTPRWVASYSPSSGGFSSFTPVASRTVRARRSPSVVVRVKTPSSPRATATTSAASKPAP